ncbi:MAG: hypothetical protein DRH08_01245 [Deltaproteobacteria bacterium]|nr:MAG: hypothetical protein DRH08_01245 [Deltaproteobacteria bacterium]
MASLGAERLREIYGWLPPEAIALFIEGYVETDDAAVAWQGIRSDPRYATWFPGNLTDDGRVRHSEPNYAAEIARYDEVFRNVGIDPKVYQGRYGELIEGDVTAQELETYRVNPMYDRIMSQSVELKTWYSDNFGIKMTDAALLGSALDPELGERVLSKQISMSEIGGEALESGFDLSKQFVSRIFDESANFDRAAAERIFQSAESLVPALSVLAQRHADPDDEFDIDDFVGANVLGDAKQMRRMKGLMAQEDSTFTGGAASDYARNLQKGGVTGLADV